MNRYKSDRQFEEEVRRIGDAVFDLPAGACKPQIFEKPKRSVEIDGVGRARHVVHLVMATTSAKLDKVRDDVERLDLAEDVEGARGNVVKKWMIVERPPEAPHVTHAKEHRVELLTIAQFRERFFNGHYYLAGRMNAPFGSARDPATDSAAIPRDEYIEPPMFDAKTGKEATLERLITYISDGTTVILVGPFGSGKSLSFREIWLKLREQYVSDSSGVVPIAVNLREHWGAQYADEILRRHARSIGFERDSDLTAAWRTGMLALLLDGFDEMASQGVVALDHVEALRRMRQDALIGARDLISKSPSGVGLLVTGRDHYFDDDKEMVHALGLQSRPYVRIRVEEFDDARAEEYLRRKGVDTELPHWLPRKALLLGYLTRAGLLHDVLSIDGSRGQARAWYEFLDLICRRESAHDRAVMDAETVQRVLENLAIEVRSTSSGVGPISGSMLAQAHTNVTGQRPGDAVLMQLQRLPGLTERDADPGSRSFVDKDLLETLQGMAVARLLLEGVAGKATGRYRVSRLNDQGWFEPLSSLGSGVAAVHLRESQWTLDGLCDFLRRQTPSQFAADLLNVAMVWASEDGGPLDFRGLELVGVHLSSIDLDELAVRGLSIRDSLVDKLIVGSLANGSDITFADTMVSSVVGVGSRDHLPATLHFEGTVEVRTFDSFQTTAAIVALNADCRVKALLSALKKLFRQRGAGRVEGAFHRGLPSEVERHIESVLRLLVREGFACQVEDVYHPIRRQARRAHRMLDSPMASTDPLLTQAASM